MALRMWSFETARFRVVASIEYDWGYKYDGDDEDGETQAKLDSGEYVAFDTYVRVSLKDPPASGECCLLGSDALGGSVYADARQFFTEHRDYAEAARDARSKGILMGSYFPQMVREAIREARATLASMPALRKVEA